MTALALAILSIPFAGIASIFEWYKPGFSSPWTRRALWLCFLAVVVAALVSIGARA